MSILDYLIPDNVCLLEAKTRNETIQELVDILSKQEKSLDKKKFYKLLIEREEIVSTGIGMGVAIPHAKMSEIEEFFLVVGIIKRKGVDWKSIDGAPVRMVFMIGGPDNKQEEYLKILSSLTQIIRDEDLRKKLISAETAEEGYFLLKNQ